MIVSKNGISQDGKQVLTPNLLKMINFSDPLLPVMEDKELKEYLEKIKDNIQKCLDAIT